MHTQYASNFREGLEFEITNLRIFASMTSKDPDAEKDWGQEEKGATEDEMVGWYRRFNEHEFEKDPGDSEG